MRTADFDFVLPPGLIAQHPARQRDESRLLVLHRNGNNLEHLHFRDLLEYIRAGDVLVLNNSRVIPARLRGVNAKTGGKFEILLLEENTPNHWLAMMRPGRSARVGVQIVLIEADGRPGNICATVVAINGDGNRLLQFSGAPDIRVRLDRLGEMPLPPYIKRSVRLAEDHERYQTVFAETDGSVAAPTAGLHFTPQLLEQIRAADAHICFVTLHVGPGTFLPVKTQILADHKMHEERFELGETAVNLINAAKNSGRRIIAVGTTTVRVLESVAARNAGILNIYKGKTSIFIHPPFQFKIVDALLTNFHLPRSTLLMLVSAFAAPGEISGRETVLAAYGEAVRERYRFFSYGDAMLVL